MYHVTYVNDCMQIEGWLCVNNLIVLVFVDTKNVLWSLGNDATQYRFMS
jgi:hypothetical protein